MPQRYSAYNRVKLNHKTLQIISGLKDVIAQSGFIADELQIALGANK